MFEDYVVRRLRTAGLPVPVTVPVCVSAVASTVLGPDAVYFAESVEGPGFVRRCSDGGFQIVVRRDADLRFNIACGLGAYLINHDADLSGLVIGYLEFERIVKRIASSLLVPASHLRDMCSVHGPLSTDSAIGDHLPPLAEKYGVTISTMFLRFGEVFGPRLRDQRAILTRSGNVLSTGPFDWSRIPVADVAAGRAWPGVKCTRLKGRDEGRTALRMLA